MKYIKAALAGKVPLWQVFWLLGILVFFLMWLAFTSIMFTFMMPAAILYSVVAQLGYNLFWCFLLWRNAFNAKWTGWGYIIRVLVVLSIIATAFQIHAMSQMWALITNNDILFEEPMDYHGGDDAMYRDDSEPNVEPAQSADDAVQEPTDEVIDGLPDGDALIPDESSVIQSE